MTGTLMDPSRAPEPGEPPDGAPSRPATEHPAAPPASAETREKPYGARELLRWGWTNLTSMRTALALLFLLALAAIPGSLIPQTATSPIRVKDFQANHPLLNRLFQPLGMYGVYSSPWFSAIYLLLFVSLIGCIVPRVTLYARTLRQPPPKVPARLDRLPASGRGTVADAGSALAGAEAWLRRHHYRVRSTDGEISAEKGYLREAGNLLFHVSLIAVLIGVACSQLLGYKGTVTVVEGEGFSNTITQYDQFHAGAWVNVAKLPGFTMVLTSFEVAFETGSVQRGAARMFKGLADLTVNATTTERTLAVNHPVTVQGAMVSLVGHGYAAYVTVTDGNKNVAYSGPVVFQPQDSNFRSVGVINAPDARPQRLAFQGFFLPTAEVTSAGAISIFPDAYNPELILNAWYGAPATETGVPQNIYVLNTTGLTQFMTGDQPLTVALKPGEKLDLPGGRGTIVFNGWNRWASVQVASAPGLPLTMGGIGAAVLGLCLSLFVRPRRLWMRVRASDDGSQTVQVGGLDRADARTGLPEHVDALLAASGAVPDAGPPVRSTEGGSS